MKKLLLIVALFALTGLSCDGDDDDDGGADGWTTSTCHEHCEVVYEQDLESSEISGVTSKILDNGDCECAFYPCMTDPCSTWCQENEGTESGHCEFLTCVCDE